MPIVPFRDNMADVFRQRYGVGAINIVNDPAREAVLQAGEEARSPVIVQSSTPLKITYRRSNLAFLREARAGNERHPRPCLNTGRNGRGIFHNIRLCGEGVRGRQLNG